MPRSTVFTRKAPEPIGPYSQAIAAHGDFLFTAGQIAIDPSTGQLVGGDIRAQTRQALNNLVEILKEAGSSTDRVVKTTVYLKEMSDFPMMNEVYAEYFSSNPPARSTVEVAKLPKDAKVEIDLIALVDRT